MNVSLFNKKINKPKGLQFATRIAFYSKSSRAQVKSKRQRFNSGKIEKYLRI